MRLEDLAPPLCIEKFSDKRDIECYNCKGTREYALLIKCKNYRPHYQVKGGQRKK